MRDRAKILVGNREVAKRYIGDRLVWENNSSLILEFEYKSSIYFLGEMSITAKDYIVNTQNASLTDIKYIQSDKKTPLSLSVFEYININGKDLNFKFKSSNDAIYNNIKKYLDGAVTIKFYSKI